MNELTLILHGCCRDDICRIRLQLPTRHSSCWEQLSFHTWRFPTFATLHYQTCQWYLVIESQKEKKQQQIIDPKKYNKVVLHLIRFSIAYSYASPNCYIILRRWWYWGLQFPFPKGVFFSSYKKHYTNILKYMYILLPDQFHCMPLGKQKVSITGLSRINFCLIKMALDCFSECTVGDE